MTELEQSDDMVENAEEFSEKREENCDDDQEDVKAGSELDDQSTLEFKIEIVDYREFKNLLVSYYDGLSRLIRINRLKDEAIAKLTKEVQMHREGMVSKLVKPLCLSIINLREDYKKTLREIDNFAKSSQDVLKYCGYILSDIEDLLAEQNVVLREDDFYLDNIAVAEQVPRKCHSNIQDLEKNERELNVSESLNNDMEQSFDGVLAFIANKNEELKNLLSLNQTSDSNMAMYVNIVSSIDDNYSDAILLPLYKSLIEAYNSVKRMIAIIETDISEENKEEKYSLVLHLILDKLESILLIAGVSIRTEITDNYDMSTSRILRVVPTEDQTLDQKVAKRHTDCYVLEDKIICPFKVDVYKFKKN